jgi:tetratricopeptide (TPR) repeat protein
MTDRNTPDLKIALEPGSTHLKIADLQFAAGRLDEALIARRKALDIFERVAAANPSNPALQGLVAKSLHDIAEVLVAMGRPDEALNVRGKSLVIWEQVYSIEPGRTMWQDSLAASYEAISDAFLKAGRIDEARAAHRKLCQLHITLASTEPNNVNSQLQMCMALTNPEFLDSDGRQKLEKAEATFARLDRNGRLPEELRKLFDATKGALDE